MTAGRKSQNNYSGRINIPLVSMAAHKIHSFAQIKKSSRKFHRSNTVIQNSRMKAQRIHFYGNTFSLTRTFVGITATRTNQNQRPPAFFINCTGIFNNISCNRRNKSAVFQTVTDFQFKSFMFHTKIIPPKQKNKNLFLSGGDVSDRQLFQGSAYAQPVHLEQAPSAQAASRPSIAEPSFFAMNSG